MGSISVCNNGTRFSSVFCSNLNENCCTNSTCNLFSPYWPPPLDGPPTYIATRIVSDWSSDYQDGLFATKVKCRSDHTASSSTDCYKSGSYTCSRGCSFGGAVTVTLNAFIPPPSAASSRSSLVLPPGTTPSSGLPSTNPSIPVLPGAKTPAARTSVFSGPETSTADNPTFQTNKPAPKSNTAAVAGGIAGGIIGLSLLLAVLAVCYRQRITRALKRTDQGKLPTWGSAHARAITADGRELEEIKPGPSPTASLLHPPSPWPLPPPPGYTPYRPHDNELDRSPPNTSQQSASSPHTFDIHPHPESPPSPPPLNTRCSQDSADNNSEAPSVSPISSHYQRHPLDESEDLKSSVYSEISSNDLFHTHNKRS